ncbi:MAG: GH36-type glycosyl hydrolase domain-containing protein [Candidatus Izemoplasmatales bacterium]
MTFGKFDDINKEYIINTPYTPFPWINYLGSEDYFVLFSNTAGGYSFYKDARKRRITRYRYNNVPIDNEGRYFYIKENDVIWNIGVKPTKTKVDHYRAHVGLGYTKITSIKDEIKATQLAFVPLDYKGEIQYITLENLSNQERKLSIYGYVEFALWDALDDMTNFQRNYSIGEVEVDKNTIYHLTEYRERRNHYSFFHVNEPFSSFDTQRDSFIGMYEDVSKPIALANENLSNSIADGWQPIAATKNDLVLKAGEKKTLIYTIGYVENPSQSKYNKDASVNTSIAQTMFQRVNTDEKVMVLFDELKDYWNQKLSYFTIDSNDEKLNRMVNIWNQYQNVVTFNFSRSASYFESGVGRGMGFRDSNQDLLGFMHMDHEKTRERILDLASTLLVDGGAYHQYSPLTKKGNSDLGSGFNDDPNWLILSTVKYVKESGDYGILDEIIPYESNHQIKGSLLEHLEKCFNNISNNLGPHGLPLIGRADWNDCLNLNCFSKEPGESFQTVQNKGAGLIAESIFIGGLFILAGNEYIALLNKIKNHDLAKRNQLIVNKMIESLNQYGRDENWFIRAYDAFGDKVGSQENKEGKIYIEPQGICVMAGLGIEDGFANKALDSAKKYLDTKYGMTLLYPAYKTYDIKLGEISSYPPGYKENGGIFCHNNPWIMSAFAKVNRADEAFELYKKIAPAYLEDISHVHKTEPYVYAQMIAGKEAKRHGEAKNSWLTGTAAWNFIAITEYILGIKADFDGLMIDPKLPESIDHVFIKRQFRNSLYEINIKRDNDKGIFRNGKKLSGQIVSNDEKTIKLTVHV